MNTEVIDTETATIIILPKNRIWGEFALCEKGKVPVNLSINKQVARSIKAFVAEFGGTERCGCKTVSELTEALWVSELLANGISIS